MRIRSLAIAALLVGLGSRPSFGGDPAPAAEIPWAKDVAAILDGVKEIAAPGALPGAVVAFGPDAFPLVLGGAGGVKRVPMAAAARWKKGRVVAIGHDAFVNAKAMEVADTGRFVEGAIRWAAGDDHRKSPRVATLKFDLATPLKSRQIEPRRIEGNSWASELSAVDVLVMSGGNPSAEERKALAAFVKSGGGLVAGLCPWGWLQVSKAPDLAVNGLQVLLAEAGLAFSAETVQKTGANGYIVAGVPGLAFHAERAIEILAATVHEKAIGADVLQASLVAQQAMAVLPIDERRIRGSVARILSERAEQLVPTAKKPLKADHPLDRFLLAAEIADAKRLDAKEVKPHPAAATFPGAPPAGAKVARKTVSLDLTVPGWHSTGLYASPGATVTARATEAKAAASLALRIGCHRDTLWHLDSWPRVPEITVERAFDGAEARVASAFGGPVYVVVPDAAKGHASIAIDGAIEAPLYVLGATSKDDWAKSRTAPAPWAELGSSKVILSVPSDRIRDLADPEALMRFWDRVLDADADLAFLPHERPRPERYVADVEISAGYMHSGYPIMTHLDAAERMVDVERLSTQGDWGLFHEMGHNHQSPHWTFEGTTEVTCNLFALYVLQHVCGVQGIAGHEALVDREKKAAEHVKAGAPFAKWKSDPFLALAMYTQLIEGFGWEPFQHVFAAYKKVSASELPTNDDAKRDQWMKAMSMAVKHNLGPFFQAWGVPTSDAARAEIAGLPGWMPPGFPPK